MCTESNTYRDTNCNADSYCDNNTEIYAGSAIQAPSTAPVATLSFLR